MAAKDAWRHISTAPKDGTRILVTVRSVEQGPADIDVAYWARAVDSSPGCIIAYADPELKCWMPMPRAGDIAAALPFDGDEKELFGSGI